jgi:peptide/nickel transport system substrate-binding protein
MIAMGQQMPDLDPHTLTLANEVNILPALFNALVRFDAQGKIVPDLAESWEWMDDTTLVFALNQGALFHNGREFTADDVKFSVERLLDPDTASRWAHFIDEIDEVIVEDKYTVKMVTDRPSARLVTSLTNCMMVAEENADELPSNPIGTGPYKLNEYIADQHIDTVVFPDHFEEGRAKLDGVKIVMYRDAEAAMAAFKAGSMDILWQLPPRNDSEIEASSDWVLYKGIVPLYQVRGLYDLSSEPFNDKRVRKALRYATDSDSIRDIAYFGRAESNWTNSIFPTEHEVYNSNLTPYTFDLQKAKDLFDEAGIPEGYTIKTPVISAAVPELTTMMEIYERNLAEIGISMVLEEMEVAAWVDLFAPAGKQYPGVYTVNGAVPTYQPDSLLDMVGANVCNWDRAEEVMAMATEAAATLDDAERTSLYAEIQEIYADELPEIIPVHFFFAHTAWSHVKDLHVDSSANLQYADVWLDK